MSWPKNKRRGRIPNPSALQARYWTRGEAAARHTTAELERVAKGKRDPLPNACPDCGDVLGENDGDCARCAAERKRRNQRSAEEQGVYDEARRTGPLY